MSHNDGESYAKNIEDAHQAVEALSNLRQKFIHLLKDFFTLTDEDVNIIFEPGSSRKDPDILQVRFNVEKVHLSIAEGQGPFMGAMKELFSGRRGPVAPKLIQMATQLYQANEDETGSELLLRIIENLDEERARHILNEEFGKRRDQRAI